MKTSKFKTTPNTVVAYYRYSSASQTENSIETQRAEVQTYCQKHGYTILHEYIDREKSGRAEHLSKRTEYLQMKDDLLSGRITPEFLILYKIDRLGRDAKEAFSCFTDLVKTAGVQIKCVTGTSPADTGKEYAALTAFLGMFFAEQEDNLISERTINGNATAALTGQFMGAAIPFGYTVVNKRFQLDQNNYKYAEQIFTRFLDGASTKEIANWLNGLNITEQIRTKSGEIKIKSRKFQHTTVSGILHNPFYYGLYIYNSNNQNIGRIEIPNNHPAIVSEEVFKQVQVKIAVHKRAPKSANEQVPLERRYLLTGKLFCGECGSTMQGFSGRSNNQTHYYYACKNRRTTKECQKNHVHKDWLEDYVVRACLRLADEYASLPHDIEVLYKKRYGSTGTKQVEKEIEKIESLADGVSQALANPDILARQTLVDRYLKQLDTYEATLADLKRQLQDVKALEEKIPTAQDIKQWLTNIKEAGASRLTPASKQKIIDVFIRSVYVSDNNIVIFFNTDNDPEPMNYHEYKQALENLNGTSEADSSPIESANSGGAKAKGTQTNHGVLNYTYYRAFAISC